MSKRIVITGASSGIGKSLAEQLSRKGHSLVLVSRRLDLLVPLAQDCLSRGAKAALVVSLDLTNLQEASRLKDSVESLGSGEIVLVNNAGQAKFGSFHEEPLDEHLAQVQVNLIGTMAATHALLPAMLAFGSGQVINVLSITVQHSFPGAAAYSASKGGAYHFGKCIAAEYRERGIRVTSVMPGATWTPIWGAEGHHPARELMLQATSVARVIRNVIHTPPSRVIDEIVVTPPKGIL